MSFSRLFDHPEQTGSGVEHDAIIQRALPRRPACDAREYECIELSNGIVAICCSDPSLQKSAAAMTVHRGHQSDPADLPGLAHFCEHMLFLGTEKYPDEAEYKRWLAERGGGDNASTAAEVTTYYFTVSADHLSGALDRFAQFFIKPLFTQSATERELHAVDSEFQRGRTTDDKRRYMLLKYQADPAHVFSKFGSGNLVTLKEDAVKKGVDVHARVKQFYAEHYSSNIMRLAVVGKEPLKDLVEWVIHRFKRVPNQKLERKIQWPGQPYPPAQLGRLVCSRPIRQHRLLVAHFPLPFTGSADYRAKCTRHVSHVIGQEGEGSLTWYLQQRKAWVTELSVGENYQGNNYSLLRCEIALTKEGLERVGDILGALFQYAALMASAGPQERLFNEHRCAQRLNFEFKERTQPATYAQNLSRALHVYSMGDALCGGTLIQDDMDAAGISQVLAALRPDNMLAFLFHQGLEEDSLQQVEPWYGTKYDSQPLAPEVLGAIERAAADPELKELLRLPGPNPFIPEDFALAPLDGDRPPERLCRDEVAPGMDAPFAVELWWKVDAKFRKPKAIFQVEALSPVISESVRATAAVRVLVMLLDDAMITKLYPAIDVSYGWSFQLSAEALTLDVTGFSDKIGTLTTALLRGLLSYELDERRFEVMKEKVWRHLRSATYDQSCVIAREATRALIDTSHYTVEAQEAAMPGLTADMMRSVLFALKKSLRLRMYCHGNVRREQVTQLADEVRALGRQCGCESLPDGEWHSRRRIVQLPAHITGEQPVEHLLQLPHRDADNTNSAVCLYFQLGRRSHHLSALSILLMQFFEPRFFNVIRTQQQVGYSVWALQTKTHNVQGLRVGAQSPKMPPGEVHERIDQFLHNFGLEVDALSEDEVRNSAECAATKVLQPSQSMVAEAARLHAEITNETLCWDRQQQVADALRRLTQGDLRQFYRSVVWPDDWRAAHRRRMLAVYCYAEPHQSLMAADRRLQARRHDTGVHAQIVHVDDVARWKAAQATYPGWVLF